jgi:hypothetical protein
MVVSKVNYKLLQLSLMGFPMPPFLQWLAMVALAYWKDIWRAGYGVCYGGDTVGKGLLPTAGGGGGREGQFHPPIVSPPSYPPPC